MTINQPIAVTRFTTDAFAPEDRHEAWATRDWPTIGPLFDTVPDGAFFNHSDRFLLGAISVHASDMAAQRYDRTAGTARRDGVDSLLVELMLTGSSVGDADGVEVRNRAGGLNFVDLAKPHAHHASGNEVFLLTMPRSVAERAGLDVGALHGASIAPGPANLLRSHLLATRAALPDLTMVQGDRLGRITLDLLGVALDVGGVREAATGAAARATAARLAARQLIADNLGSPLLGVAWLCARLGVQRSQLYRLFDDEGGVQAYIRDRRLDRVAATLADPGRRDRLVDLADRFGFSDAAHLSRLFRARFGTTPSDYRARSIEATRG